MSSLSRLWLLIPTWLFLALDVTFTLTGQPKEYWAGDFATAIEVNPAALPILAFHPGLFACLAVGWAGTLGVVGFRSRGAWATWLLAGVAFAHALGGCSWIIRSWGWIVGVCYLAAASQFARICWNRAGALRSHTRIP